MNASSPLAPLPRMGQEEEERTSWAEAARTMDCGEEDMTADVVDGCCTDPSCTEGWRLEEEEKAEGCCEARDRAAAEQCPTGVLKSGGVRKASNSFNNSVCSMVALGKEAE
jgi:hypothetical protein